MTVRELGHLVLYVRDVTRSAHFYRDVLGWRQIMPEPGVNPVGVAAFSSGRTHHELLLIEVGKDALPIPAGRRVGMYHFGLKVGETDDDLRAMVATLHQAGATIVGASDHTVTHSLYIEDPDGNEIELYVDVPGVDWKADPSLIASPVRPLSSELLSGAGDGFMRTLRVDDEDALGAASKALRAGEVVLVPTDTVYGLAAMPDRAEAVQRIYLAKNRPTHLPLPVLAASLGQVRQLGVEFPDAATILSARWWPGPLTMAFGLSPSSPRPQWLAGREEVAVRIPAHAFLLALMRDTGVLMVTSANRHGEPTSPSAGEAGSHVAPYVDVVIDAGTLAAVPSTLVNVRGTTAVVEREGAISGEAIAAALDRSA